MSTAKRLISGTFASWARIGVTMFTQLALVPIFLNYWNVGTYGVWIAIQAFVTVLSTFDRGYVDYLGFRFLQMGKDKGVEIGHLLWSGIRTSILTAAIQGIPISLFCISQFLTFFLGDDRTDLNYSQVGIALFLQWFAWVFFTNTTGLLFRGLVVYGYFPRMGWWDVFIALITALTSVMVVSLNGDLIDVSLGTALSTILLNTGRYLDIRRLLQRESIVLQRFDKTFDWKNYYTSLGLTFRYFLENFRQQGVRIILAPLAGMSGLAAFATMRTAANVTQQGLLTITSPLLPELMRFLNNKEDQKMEASFASVWLVLVAFLSPFVVILQAVAPSLFVAWTNGKVEFDPWTFGLLSTSVLLYALAQPAIAIVTGNNLLKAQGIVSMIVATVLILCVVITVPLIGITGAGLALALAELIAACLYIYYSKAWLATQNMRWPSYACSIATLSVAISTSAITLTIMLPAMPYLGISIGLFLLAWNLKRYWSSMPLFVLDRLNKLLSKVKKRGGEVHLNS